MDISNDELNQLQERYSGLGDAFWFYDGTVQLRFNRKQWRYYLVKPDGSYEPQHGVTSIVKIIDKSAPLMAWAVKRALEKLRKLFISQCLFGDEEAQGRLFLGELDQIIREAKTADREEFEAAGETGHDAHSWIEQYIKTVLTGNDIRKHELLAKFPEDPRAANACIAAINWMADHNVRWICTERKVYSKSYKYAGTMDGLALIDSCKDPLCCRTSFRSRLSLTDWKTSNALYIEYLMQTAAYQQAYQEETGEKIEDRWVIRLGKDDAEFDPWHVEGEHALYEDFHGFAQALALSISVENIEDRVAEIKSTRKAAKAEAEKLLRQEALKKKCKNADKYKGVRKPTCNDGHPCEACIAKYAERHPNENDSNVTGTKDGTGQSVDDDVDSSQRTN